MLSTWECCMILDSVADWIVSLSFEVLLSCSIRTLKKKGLKQAIQHVALSSIHWQTLWTILVAIEYFRRGSSNPFVYTGTSQVDTSSTIVYMLAKQLS